MFYVVASIINNDKKTVGYRLFNTDNIGKGSTIKDVSVAELIKAITNNAKAFGNVGIAGGKLKGSNGSLDRYAKVSISNEIVSKAVVAILCRVKPKNDFVVADCMGNVTRVSNDEAITLAKSVGIANAKMVEKDGKHIISSISGEYPTIEEKDTNRVKTKFIAVSDNDSIDVTINKIAENVKNPDMRIVGKLNKANSDSAIKGLINKFHIVDAISNKDNNKAAEIIREVATRYMPVLSKVCDKKVVIENTTGLKALYTSVTGDDTSLIDRAIAGMENDRVKI